jgi:trans-2,3-dihydro-3-hydroxyanthranilate isomerase
VVSTRHAVAMTILPFAIVDVFASTPLSGNPLAVVMDADELSETQLQAIAHEFNQSETTFVMRPRQAGAQRRLRSFTASGVEVAGAGHNALGAWWWLVNAGHEPAGHLCQELGGRVLELDVARIDNTLEVRMRQAAPIVGGELPAGELAPALGIGAERLCSGNAQVISTGTPHLLIAARDCRAVDAAEPSAGDLALMLARCGAQGAYLYAVEKPGRAYARFFNPTVGLFEDPATGSAAGPLAWWLSRGRHGRATVLVEQGHAVGRPSTITVDVDVEGDLVTLVGSAVISAEGALHIDD